MSDAMVCTVDTCRHHLSVHFMAADMSWVCFGVVNDVITGVPALGDIRCGCRLDVLHPMSAIRPADVQRARARLKAYELFGRLYRANGAEAKDTREALALAEETR